MGFTQDAAGMDADAYRLLGDEILYKRAGTADYVQIMGFYEPEEAAPSFGELDPARPSRKIKVSKADVPSPTPGDRWKLPLLGTTVVWSQTNKENALGFRDWIIEVQKASTQ